ncbi:unnamed protein product [Bathycoccus prasinos]
MRFFRRMQRRDDSSLHSHSHSSMNNNIWYGADDAPGVIDVDISSSVAMLDYSYYNDNSAEYTSDGSGGKIEYVYVHDDDDIRDGISSNYRLDDDEEEEEEDNDIVAEEDFVEIENLRAGGEEEEESAPVAVVVKGEELENTTEEEEEDRKIGRDYYTEFDDFINAVALEEEEEEEEQEEQEEEREGVRANGENMDEEERTREKESEKEEEDKLESSQKRERIGSHDSATTTTRDVQEESEKRSQTGRAHGMEGENERRKRGGGGEEMKGGVFRHFNTFTKSISHDVNVRSLLTNVLLGDKWVIHFDGIPSIRFRIDFNVENFRTWKRWTATRCSDISKWLQKRRRAAAESRRRHREEYIRSVTKSPTKEKKEEGTPKKLLPIFSSRQKKDVAIKDDINSPQSGMNSIDKAPSRSTPKSWKEKEEEALFKILNARKKKEANGRNNNAAASDKTRTLPSSKMFKDKIARRATILLHICPPK